MRNLILMSVSRLRDGIFYSNALTKILPRSVTTPDAFIIFIFRGTDFLNPSLFWGPIEQPCVTENFSNINTCVCLDIICIFLFPLSIFWFLCLTKFPIIYWIIVWPAPVLCFLYTTQTILSYKKSINPERYSKDIQKSCKQIPRLTVVCFRFV